MSDVDGGFSDDDYANDEAWLYVEDYYDEVDDLAEHACPSPSVAVATLEPQDYDPFDFFEDLTYLSDAYQDISSTSGKKRKRSGHEDSAPRRANKHVKRESVVEERPNVLWMSYADRTATAETRATRVPKKMSTFNLLGDWRERFKNSKGFDMRPQRRNLDQKANEEDPMDDADEWEDEDDDEDENMNNSKQIEPDGEGIDTGNLQSVLALLGNGDHLSQLKEMLRARGLDGEAIDVVLEDMLSGREPEYASDEGDEEEDKTANETEETLEVEEETNQAVEAGIPTVTARRKRARSSPQPAAKATKKGRRR